jgi:hypothetical protein
MPLARLPLGRKGLDIPPKGLPPGEDMDPIGKMLPQPKLAPEKLPKLYEQIKG